MARQRPLHVPLVPWKSYRRAPPRRVCCRAQAVNSSTLGQLALPYLWPVPPEDACLWERGVRAEDRHWSRHSTQQQAAAGGSSGSRRTHTLQSHTLRSVSRCSPFPKVPRTLDHRLPQPQMVHRRKRPRLLPAGQGLSGRCYNSLEYVYRGTTRGGTWTFVCARQQQHRGCD